MATTMTNYTTYDLASYYADVNRLPRVMEQERLHLQHVLGETTTAEALAQARTHLIESYLLLAKHIAITTCPPTHYQFLPDLIGVVNLTLVTLAYQYDFAARDGFTPYFFACAQNAINRALGEDRLIRVPSSAIGKAKRQGTTHQLRALQPDSLDQRMTWDDSDGVKEPLVTPLLPSEAAPERDPQQRAQVETLLSYLSPRAQAILRLRYGLSEDNERTHSTCEIAALLGIAYQHVLTTERDALTRLRAFVRGEATLSKRNGKPCISYPATQNTYTITPQEQATMLHVYSDLCSRHVYVSGRLLAQHAGVSGKQAAMFLCVQRGTSHQAERARQRQERLEEVWRRLEAQGVPITSSRLAKEASVRRTFASAFVAAKKRESDATASTRQPPVVSLHRCVL